MKKLLFFITILPTFCFGQVFWEKAADTIPVGNLDTVKCELLSYDSNIPGGSIVFILNGYTVNVRKKYTNEPGLLCMNCENYWQFVCYLDENKKPLATNIKVWMSR